jgi:hypothetical protein
MLSEKRDNDGTVTFFPTLVIQPNEIVGHAPHNTHRFWRLDRRDIFRYNNRLLGFDDQHTIGALQTRVCTSTTNSGT